MGTEFDLTLGYYVEKCTKLGIFIDFDGTLSPLARTPELAFIPPETKKVKKSLFHLSVVASPIWIKIDAILNESISLRYYLLT